MKLYIYDHCPYCVKARMIFGFKGIKLELITLLNDDEKLPIKMIGKKLVPILQKEDGSYMPESLDIIDYIDNNYGAPMLNRLHDSVTNPIERLEAELKEYSYKLAMPTWLMVDRGKFLAEFATEEARAYFKTKKEAYIGSFSEHFLARDTYIKLVNQLLIKLEELLYSSESACGKLALIDIHLFATLRSLSIIKGFEYGPKLLAYRKFMSNYAKIELHDKIAL